MLIYYIRNINYVYFLLLLLLFFVIFPLPQGNLLHTWGKANISSNFYKRYVQLNRHEEKITRYVNAIQKDILLSYYEKEDVRFRRRTLLQMFALEIKSVCAAVLRYEDIHLFLLLLRQCCANVGGSCVYSRQIYI